jgi:hypothetical protein
MTDVLLVAAGPFGIAVGVLVTVGALLSRFGVRTVISPPRNDQHHPQLLALGAALVLGSVSITAGTRIDDFWGEALDLSAMALCVVALVLLVKSSGNRAKNGSEPG